MIWIIARREFLDYLKSLRFLIGVFVMVGLVALITLINVGDFKQREQEYTSALSEMKGDPFNVRIYKAPQSLSTLVQGSDRSLGSRVDVTPYDIPVRSAGYLGQYVSEHSRYVAGFAAVDFAFIVRVVMSLMVIFLLYSTIAGEKHFGTLRVVLSNPVPRHALLLGKCVGGLGVVLVALVASAALALLILTAAGGIPLTSHDALRVIAIVGVSALYLTFFFMISLFVSVAVTRPGVALAVLLQIWIFLVVLYPNLSVGLASNITTPPSEDEIAYRKMEAYAANQKETESLQSEINKAYASGTGIPADLMIKQTELSARTAEAKHRIDADLDNALRQQARLAESLSMLSPASSYDRAVLRLSGTGLDEFDRFMAAVERYWHVYIDASKERFRTYETRVKMSFPVFEYAPESLANSLVSVWADVVVLAVSTLIFFGLAYTAFLRKDVR